MPNLDTLLTLKIDQKTKERLEQLANQDGRSVSNYVRMVLNKIIEGKIKTN